MTVDALTALPPGPRMPSALQTAIWFGNAQWMLRQCTARFGDTFRLRILNEGTWVVLSHPVHVKQVFTGDPRVYHAGGEPDSAPGARRAFRPVARRGHPPGAAKAPAAALSRQAHGALRRAHGPD